MINDLCLWQSLYSLSNVYRPRSLLFRDSPSSPSCRIAHLLPLPLSSTASLNPFFPSFLPSAKIERGGGSVFCFICLSFSLFLSLFLALPDADECVPVSFLSSRLRYMHASCESVCLHERMTSSNRPSVLAFFPPCLLDHHENLIVCWSFHSFRPSSILPFRIHQHVLTKKDREGQLYRPLMDASLVSWSMQT